MHNIRKKKLEESVIIKFKNIYQLGLMEYYEKISYGININL